MYIPYIANYWFKTVLFWTDNGSRFLTLTDCVINFLELNVYNIETQ